MSCGRTTVFRLGGVTGYLGTRPLRPGPWEHPLWERFSGKVRDWDTLPALPKGGYGQISTSMLRMHLLCTLCMLF